MRSSRKAVIAQIRNEPERSYFFYGVAGTGKTHFATALYIDAVEQWAIDCFRPDIPSLTAVFRFTAGGFLNSCVDWARRGDKEVKAPPLTVANILAQAGRGYRICLFLEEIDKFNPTEFKLTELAAIVDAVYASKGQLVTTSNTSVPDLYAKWNSNHAHAILRRFAEGDGMAIEFTGREEFMKYGFDERMQKLTGIETSYGPRTEKATAVPVPGVRRRQPSR